MIMKLRTEAFIDLMTQEDMNGKDAIAQIAMFLAAANMLAETLLETTAASEDILGDEYKETWRTIDDIRAAVGTAILASSIPMMRACPGDDLQALDDYLQEFEDAYIATRRALKGGLQ